MAAPVKPTTPAQKIAAANFKFKLDDNVPVPVRSAALPDYGVEEILEAAKIGQSVYLPVETVPVEHSRAIAAKLNREWKKDEKGRMIVTRSTSEGEGDAKKTTGMRLFVEKADAKAAE